MNKLTKIQAGLLGVMIGDAMGMPVESMSADDILTKTEGKCITGFINPIQKKIRDTQDLQIGSTTDDWQLTEAIGKSLVRRGDFDIYDIALAHVEALETSKFGWGTTTRLGMEQIKLYIDTRGKDGRNPNITPTEQTVKSKYSHGCGNGVAMKIAPVAIISSGDIQDLQTKVKAIGRLTHPDPRATTAASVVAYIINNNILNEKYEYHYQLGEALDWALVDVMCVETKDSFHDRLKKLNNKDLLFGPIKNLQKEVGTSCLAIESVCFALAVYFRNMDNFRTGILEAINAGGDTDTTAAMVGAMIGSRVGLEGIPEEWRQFHPDFQKAMTLGSDLHRVYFNEKK